MNINLTIRGQHRIGHSHSPYLIAEIGTNHNRDIRLARDLIIAAADTGFDSVKFQIYEADEIVSETVLASDYGMSTCYGNISAQEMFERHLKTPKEWFPELLDLSHAHGLDCIVTVHGQNGIDWAKALNFDAIKIASMDHNNLPLLKSLVNRINVPILLSLGMADLEAIDTAVSILIEHKMGVGIFHCVSIYPPSQSELRLTNIPFLANRFPIPIGFSDHTSNVASALTALCLGAQFFEKHVTLNKDAIGPDHCFALDPEDMRIYVKEINSLFSEMRAGRFLSPSEREMANRNAYLKSIIVARDVAAGHLLTIDDLVLLRPGTGIPPKDLPLVVNRRLARDLKKGDLLAWNDLSD